MVFRVRVCVLVASPESGTTVSDLLQSLSDERHLNPLQIIKGCFGLWLRINCHPIRSGCYLSRTHLAVWHIEEKETTVKASPVTIASYIHLNLSQLSQECDVL